MPLHLIKLAVGCESVKELKGWVAERMATAKKKGLPLRHVHITRMTPKRDGELLAGGSLYWVIKGEIAAREKIIAHRAVPRQGRHRALPPGDAAQGVCGLAAADAPVPGLALPRRGRRAGRSHQILGRQRGRDAGTNAARIARSGAALIIVQARGLLRKRARLHRRYVAADVTMCKRSHSDGGISIGRLVSGFRSTMSSSSGSTPMSLR